MAKKLKVKFDIDLYALQKEVVNYIDGKPTLPLPTHKSYRNSIGEEYRFFVLVIGRQSGKSFLDKYIALYKAINEDKRVMWVSPTQRSAIQHWNELKEYIYNSGMLEMPEHVRPIIRENEKTIRFPDGGFIIIKSTHNDPDNLRGTTLDLIILDEAAFMRNGSYIWWSVVIPMITASGGKILITTTPNGKNWIYDLFLKGQPLEAQKEASGLFKSWQAPSKISPYQNPELLEQIKLSMPSLQFREEFEAEFLADSGGVFAGVQSAAIVEMLAEPNPLANYCAGIDIGYTRDYSVFTVIDMDTREQVYIKRFTDVGTINILQTVLEELNKWKPRITHIEKNGNIVFVEMLKNIASGKPYTDIKEMIDISDEQTIGGHRIKAVHIDNQTKRSAVENLAAAIEYARLFLLKPQNNMTYIADIQISEMSTYIRKNTNTGYVLYQAEEGAHDDTVSALYLAYMGMPMRSLTHTPKAPKKRRNSPFKRRRKW